ncbi:unnamed protein product [Durusdinium trenchii]|uniref:Uncharacterized protein n=1 Tax=Durusdinium trenchii TaxID=1381693 RepID=A0ABP0J1T3_9DINO
MCDRQIVKECVCIWFGSEEAFEELIRSEVLDALSAGLQNGVFTRSWSLCVCSPLLWAFWDLSASFAAHGLLEDAFEFGIAGLVLWFLCAPMYIDYGTWIIRRYCHLASTTFWECLKNFEVLLLALLGFSFIAGTFVLCRLIWSEQRYRVVLFGGAWCLLALCHFVYRRFSSSLNDPSGRDLTHCALRI